MKNTVTLALLAAFTLGGVSFATPEKAYALSCVRDSFSAEWALKNSDAIFVGKVTNIYGISADDSLTGGTATADFEITEYWKGDVKSTMTLSVPRYAWSAQEAFFEKGESYLVSASVDEETGVLRAHVDCSITSKLENAGDALTDLGKGTKPGKGELPIKTPGIFLFSGADLTVGSTGADVEALQTLLQERGFLTMPAGVAKGYFGQLTKSALMSYQSSVGIVPAHGYFGPITRARINGIPAGTQ